MAEPRPDRTSDVTSTPVWLKVSGIVVLIAVVLFVVMMLAGGVSHGPGMHAPPSP